MDLDWTRIGKLIVFSELWIWFCILVLAPIIETTFGCSVYGCFR